MFYNKESKYFKVFISSKYVILNLPALSLCTCIAVFVEILRVVLIEPPRGCINRAPQGSRVSSTGMGKEWDPEMHHNKHIKSKKCELHITWKLLHT